MSFDFKHWIEVFKDNPGYNDVRNVTVETFDTINWKAMGIHGITQEENDRRYAILFDVHCKQDERDRNQNVYWSYGDQWSRIVRADKPTEEVSDLPLTTGMDVSMWIPGGDKINGLSLDNAPYGVFVFFQEVDKEPEPTPEPEEPEPEEPEPEEPEPIAMTAKTMISSIQNLRILKSTLDGLPVDEQGYVTIERLDITNA